MFSGLTPFDDGAEDCLPMHLNILTKEPDFNFKYFHGQDAAVDFIKQCLVKDYTKRKSATLLLEHSWIRRIKDKVENARELNSVKLNLLKSAARYACPKTKIEQWQLLCLLNLAWLKVSHKDINAASKFFRLMDADHDG